jgi:hypothetical protein
MFLYNVTTKVSTAIAARWEKWALEKHIPDLLATGCFTEVDLLQLLEIDDSEGPTFAIQCKAESKALYNRYIDKFAPALRQESFDTWGDQFISFRSLMRVVN